jgi:hypothetical protein
MFFIFKKNSYGCGDAGCNSSIGRLGQEDWEFRASLGYIVRLKTHETNQKFPEKAPNPVKRTEH